MIPRQYTLRGMGKHRCSSEQEGSGCKDTDLAHLNQLTWRAVGVKTLTLHTWSTQLEDTDLAHLNQLTWSQCPVCMKTLTLQWAWRCHHCTPESTHLECRSCRRTVHCCGWHPGSTPWGKEGRRHYPLGSNGPVDTGHLLFRRKDWPGMLTPCNSNLGTQTVLSEVLMIWW